MTTCNSLSLVAVATVTYFVVFLSGCNDSSSPSIEKAEISGDTASNLMLKTASDFERTWFPKVGDSHFACYSPRKLQSLFGNYNHDVESESAPHPEDVLIQIKGGLTMKYKSILTEADKLNGIDESFEFYYVRNGNELAFRAYSYEKGKWEDWESSPYSTLGDDPSEMFLFSFKAKDGEIVSTDRDIRMEWLSEITDKQKKIIDAISP